MCGAKSWEIAEMIAGLFLKNETIQIGGTLVPMLLVVCTKCGFLAHFAATTLGLLSPREPEEKK